MDAERGDGHDGWCKYARPWQIPRLEHQCERFANSSEVKELLVTLYQGDHVRSALMAYWLWPVGRTTRIDDADTDARRLGSAVPNAVPYRSLHALVIIAMPHML